MDRLQQHAIGIAMDDAFDRLMRVIADRIGALFRRDRQLARIGDELSRDRVASIGRIDQSGDITRDRNGVAIRDGGELGRALRRDQPRFDEFLRPSQRVAHWNRSLNWLCLEIFTFARLSKYLENLARRSRGYAPPPQRIQEPRQSMRANGTEPGAERPVDLTSFARVK